jgi:hypothetical protein
MFKRPSLSPKLRPCNKNLRVFPGSFQPDKQAFVASADRTAGRAMADPAHGYTADDGNGTPASGRQEGRFSVNSPQKSLNTGK